MRTTIATLLSLAAAAWAWAPGSVLSAQSPTLDACTVLTREEITTLSGNQDPGAPDPGGSGDPTTCRWGETTPTGRVALYPNVDPNEPKGLALKQLLDRGMKARAITDLGDDAVFLADDDGTPSGTLFVRVGHWRVVITREAEPKGTAESTLPTLTAFAKAAISEVAPSGLTRSSWACCQSTLRPVAGPPMDFARWGEKLVGKPPGTTRRMAKAPASWDGEDGDRVVAV
jgi:hypothetical protein